jgi:cephalosporin hydroxylase|tara:strand:- start:28 stop:876 length:849 start_codon:yes stop_codon:yes gene_type:complete
MNIRTFYTLFYRHRFEKASLIRKVYLALILPFKFLYNYFYMDKKKDLDDFSLKNSFLFSKNLNFLFEFFNSDKGEEYINQYAHPSKRNNIKIKAHGYSKYYEKFFLELRDQKINILEIGSFYGNASAAMFFYFKNANIFGADINPNMFNYTSKRIKSFFVNSSSVSSIEKNILDKKIKYKIIIEDASHMLKDQIISLFYLFPILESGGYFIVEELDFPEKRKDMRVGQEFPDLKNILKNIQTKQDFSSNYINQNLKDYFLDNVETIDVFKGNINEIAIIKKK